MPRPARFALLLVFSGVAAGSTAAAPGVASAPPPEARELERAAEQAVAKGGYGRAAALLRGLEPLAAPSPEPAFRLAEVYSLAGQYDQAIDAYRRYAASPLADPTRKERAAAEAARLADAPPPFLEAAPRAERATAEAKLVFKSGLRAERAKDDDLAERLLTAALELDPTLPGPYRIHGVLHGRLGDQKRELAFLTEYLRLRPDGAIADAVRTRLAGEKLLGRVSLEASFPCEVLLDGRPTGKSTPATLAIPAGRYTITLVNDRYHTARNLRIEVAPDAQVQRSFRFGLLRTKLEPWARVRIDGKDVGLWDEIGVPEGKHTISFRAFDASKERTVELDLTAGARKALSW
jgi:hypothetical protein